ncbi:DUF5677 domain-containing protein [Micromonospora chalcea]
MSNDSILLQFINDKIAQAGDRDELDFEQVIDEAISQAEDLAPDLVESVRGGIERRVAWRKGTAYAVRRAIRKDWEAAIRSFDRLLAASEEVHQRLVADMTESLEKDIRPELNPSQLPNSLAGRELKMLVLLSVHARVCKTATEVAELARSGFGDGALARLRTVYEVAVVHFILALAPYGVCERYYNYGSIEYLEALKAQRRRVAARGWGRPSDDEVDEAEREAQEVTDFYGAEIRRPYEWARPLFPNRSGRISFADLDKFATNHGLRGMYLVGNHGIHAGAYGTLSNFDASKPYLNSTRPSIDSGNFALLISGAAKILSLVSFTTCRQIPAECKSLDSVLMYASVEEAENDVYESIDADVQRKGQVGR